jgi:hypothetical protein
MISKHYELDWNKLIGVHSQVRSEYLVDRACQYQNVNFMSE